MGSADEETVTCDVAHPLKDLVDGVGFILHSSLTELLSAKTFRGKLKLQLALFGRQVEDAITAIVENIIDPGLGGVAGDVEENGIRRGER